MDKTHEETLENYYCMKRLRVFCGPNGSGKTLLYKSLLENKHFHLCPYVNADEIQAGLLAGASIPVPPYFDPVFFLDSIKHSPFRTYGISESEINAVRVVGNAISISGKVALNSYFAAAVAEAIRQTLLRSEHSFAFETVMSDVSKIEFIKIAKQDGFKVYVYFVTTGDVNVNIARVKNRVLTGGHDVPEEKIKSRYDRTMENLVGVIPYTDRTYLFDSGGESMCLIASVASGTVVDVHSELVPTWFGHLMEQFVINE